MLSFLTSHGINPVSPPPEFYELLATHDEEVVSVDPLDLRLTFTIDDDSITVSVGDDLSVNDVSTESKPDED